MYIYRVVLEYNFESIHKNDNSIVMSDVSMKFLVDLLQFIYRIKTFLFFFLAGQVKFLKYHYDASNKFYRIKRESMIENFNI